MRAGPGEVTVLAVLHLLFQSRGILRPRRLFLIRLGPALRTLHLHVADRNSRLRGYFFLRRHLGPDDLEMGQFFLNHRRWPRSERAERRDKSPREHLTGALHWLELLGDQRFEQN